jgi:hypothetical protein
MYHVLLMPIMTSPPRQAVPVLLLNLQYSFILLSSVSSLITCDNESNQCNSGTENKESEPISIEALPQRVQIGKLSNAAVAFGF